MTGATLHKDDGLLFEEITAFSIAGIQGEGVWVKKIDKVKNQGGYQ
jgi:hypothetical protein